MPKSNPWRSRMARATDVNVIDSGVRHSSRRRAKIAFIVSLLVGWVLATTVAWQVMPTTILTITDPTFRHILAVIVGGFFAFCAAFVIGLVVWIWPVLRILLHWFLEITLFGTLLTGFASLSTVVAVWQAGLITAGSVGGLFVFPPLRDRINALAWCVISRHRLRMAFADFIRGNRTGSLPFILFAWPTPVGERVWVWLRPGLSLSELEGRGEQLAVACWARQVTVTAASDKYAALLRFDIKRRDTFTGPVSSPLHTLITGPSGSTPAAATPELPTALDITDVPADALVSSSTNGTNGTASSAKRSGRTATAVVDRQDGPDASPPAGEDLSDWI